MDFTKMTNAGLLKLYGAVRDALEMDDMLHRSNLHKIHGVRDFSDWKTWSDALAAELDKRSVKYRKIDW